MKLPIGTAAEVAIVNSESDSAFEILVSTSPFNQMSEETLDAFKNGMAGMIHLMFLDELQRFNLTIVNEEIKLELADPETFISVFEPEFED